MELVTIDDVRAAAKRIEGVAVRTPVVPCRWAEGLWLKPENLQPIGAFKVRGATNAVGALSDEQAAKGVVTHSSGNHGQALAYAANTRGIPATIVVPDVAPRVKIDAMRALGAELILVPPAQRLTATDELVAERGMALVPPYDHNDIIAGQGTIGVEMVADLPSVRSVLVPVGGGGLASGVAVAVKALRPDVRVIGVEPALAADAADSLAAGHIVQWTDEQRYRTSADGVRTNIVERTFAHLSRYLDGIVRISEDEIMSTVRRLALEAHLVAEPSGALAPAAFLHHRSELPDGPAVAIVSGGNIEPAMLRAILSDD
ncbi:threonine ammonia-lyase [Fodinicola acaciae]|uniref:threonine ammonia-lyase n=1 Tax=Fodinicola acaciae TaxID=2681555 RepID=UPI0013D5D7A2|nr:threonine/serine dehydratase [Fodinicola acaciae]